MRRGTWESLRDVPSPAASCRTPSPGVKGRHPSTLRLGHTALPPRPLSEQSRPRSEQSQHVLAFGRTYITEPGEKQVSRRSRMSVPLVGPQFDSDQDYTQFVSSKQRVSYMLNRMDIVDNVHKVEEVQQMASINDRVSVKLEFLRNNEVVAAPWVRAVEDEFMEVEPFSGSPLVDVTRIRASTPRPSSWDLSTHAGASLRTSQRSSKVSARSSTASPALRLERLQQNAARADQAVESARNLQIDKRVKALYIHKRRHTRLDQSSRTCTVTTCQAAARALLVMRGFLVAYHKAFEFSDTVDTDDDQRSRRIGMELWKGSAAMMDEQELNCFRWVPQLHLHSLGRQVIEARLDDCNSRRKNRLWRMWAKLLRCITFAVIVMRPYRKHKAMTMIQELFKKSERTLRFRHSTKAYVKQVKVLQRTMRCSLRIQQIVRQRILLPQIWAIETMILGRLSKIEREVVDAAIAHHLERTEVARWRLTVAGLAQRRDEMLRSAHSILQEVQEQPRHQWLEEPSHRSLHRMGSDMNRPLAPMTDNYLTAALQTAVARTAQATPRSGSPSSTRSATTFHFVPKLFGKAQKLAKDAAQVKRLKNNQFSASTIGEEGEQEFDSHWSSDGIASLDRMRLDSDEHDELARRAYRENIDCWWELYRSWKRSRDASSHAWRRWLTDMRGKGPDFWREPPPALDYPCIITKVHEATMKHELMQRLDHREPVQQLDVFQKVMTLGRSASSDPSLF